MTDDKLRAMSTLGLAHVGDGVYELLTRTYLAETGVTAVAKLHRETVRRVCAPAQARAAAKLVPVLTEAEAEVFRRGRNAKVNSVPKAADTAQYHAATGLEALFGWLWLRGETERVRALYAVITEEPSDAA
jgi:ribonuclease-3 family protein